jgi:glycosyltransferase involved in cell wall biosynthesis
MTNPTICFATICKNESHIIKKTLESIYKYINYWVICDTGSTDNTREIITEFFKEKNIPGELHIDEFKDFGYNKSLLMKRAQYKADYILQLDADDPLIGEFKFTQQDVGHDVYLANVKRGTNEYKAYALYNAKYLWRFCSVAHTVIRCVDKPSFTTGSLTHYDFYVSSEDIGARKADPEKYLKDAKKLKKQFFDTLLDDPDELNSRSVFYIAQSYMDYGMYEEAIRWYRLYTKLKDNWIEEHFEAQMRIARCHIVLDSDSNLIEQEMLKAINIFPDRAEPYFILGQYFNIKKQHEKAYQYLKQIQSKDLESVKKKYLLFINEFNYRKYVNDELSVACYWTGRYDEGIKLTEEIINDPKFAYDRDRLAANLGFLKEKVSQ